MKLSLGWISDFVNLPNLKSPDNLQQVVEKLTMAGLAVEGMTVEIMGNGDLDLEGTVIDFEITTNRPDAMNHYGVAREVSALYDLSLRPIEPKLSNPQGKSDVTIDIQEPDLCPRFTAREIRGATIMPSPANIASRLQLIDQRPISNAVDATNYVLWESGKPTHVFDLDLLEGRRLVIRRAQAGETLKTLDGMERTLSTDDLVVADAKKPVGLAGVMGGFDTMITERTKNILIESAWWDPATVRRMSKRHGLHTDASHRFERGADFESTVVSTNRVAELILNSGGTLIGEVIDVMARQLDLAPVELDLREVQRILGEKLSTLEINRILTRLGFTVLPGSEDRYLVHIPSWRLDIEREIDIIEELARLHGYDKFANTLPAYSGEVRDLPDAHKDARLRSSLLALGYNEAISLTFISKEDARRFSTAPELDLANPLSDEASVMRTSMVPSMLNMLAYNLNRGTDNVRLFEAGNVFEASGEKSMPLELKRISIGATGNVDAEVVRGLAPGAAARPFSFFDLKGDVETLLAPFGHWTLYYDAHAVNERSADYYHPGRTARAVMDGATVAHFGQIHPDVAAARKLRQDVFVAEIYLDRLYQHDLSQVRYEALPRFPAVERDFSFVFDDGLEFEKIHQSVSELGIDELRSFVPVEIFRGEKVGAGKYSILMRAKLQSSERTLRDDEVAQWSGQIAKALEALGGVQRA